MFVTTGTFYMDDKMRDACHQEIGRATCQLVKDVRLILLQVKVVNDVDLTKAVCTIEVKDVLAQLDRVSRGY